MKTQETLLAEIETDIYMTVKRRSHAYAGEHAGWLDRAAKRLLKVEDNAVRVELFLKIVRRALKLLRVVDDSSGSLQMKINASIMLTACVIAAGASAADWKVPNWTTIVTEPGAIQEQYGRTKKWCGHVQGMCVSSNAIYFSFHDQIVKTDWYGRLLNRVPVDPHGGDICLWNGKLYTGVWLKPKVKDEKWCSAIYMYDAETLALLKTQKVKSKDAGVDGITCLDGIIYLAMGATGKYDPEKKCGRTCWYGKFNAETLEPIGEPFGEDHGDDSVCGSQNMTTDGKYIYSSHYTHDEAERTPNVVVHDKDTFKVVAKCRFGWNHGIDVVPGGKDGAVRFAWVFTPNWIGRLCKKEKLPIYGIVQFVELKDGQVFDFTMHGGGYDKEIER